MPTVNGIHDFAATVAGPPLCDAARALRALLFGVGPGDPLIIAAGIALVLLATFAGSLIPAFKAVWANPLTAKRAD